MNSFNPRLAAVALARVDQFEKPGFVPADAGGSMPVDAGPPGAAPGGIPPELAAAMGGGGGGGGGGAPPGLDVAMGGGGGEIPPELAAAIGGGGPSPGGAPPPGGGPPPGADIGEQLASVNSKLDQLIGTLQGFLMGQESAGGAKGSGGGGGQKELLGLVQQMATQMGISSPDAMGGMGAGGAGAAAPLGAGMPGAPAAPAGPLAPAMPGMTLSASDARTPPNKHSPAARVSRLLTDLAV